MSVRANASWLKAGLLLAKPKPMSNGGSTSVITYLRRGKKSCGKWQSGQRSEMM